MSESLDADPDMTAKPA